MLIFIRQVQAGSKADNSKHNEAFHKLLPTNLRNLSNLLEIPSVQSETCIKYLIWQTTLPRKLQFSLSLSIHLSGLGRAPVNEYLWNTYIYIYLYSMLLFVCFFLASMEFLSARFALWMNFNKLETNKTHIQIKWNRSLRCLRCAWSRCSSRLVTRRNATEHRVKC